MASRTFGPEGASAPRHGSGVGHVAFHRVKFARVFELAADLSDLHNPPFCWAGMQLFQV
jgi:hypothetical protein